MAERWPLEPHVGGSKPPRPALVVPDLELYGLQTGGFRASDDAGTTKTVALIFETCFTCHIELRQESKGGIMLTPAEIHKLIQERNAFKAERDAYRAELAAVQEMYERDHVHVAA